MAGPTDRDSRIWAVLGPTNTGKTHLAVERMLAHPSGVIGLPLRLLAREVYDRVRKVKGDALCALVTGEERIIPASARYVVATVEAMPLDRAPSFVAIDEIQLATDPDRGHIFTDRLLRARGTAETMFLGSDTMRGMVRALVPGIPVERRERLSQLTHSGSSKITRLQRRTAIVAFSAEEVYSIAELIRRHRGGAAVVMGALSPRTRNAQVELYQSGEVDFLVATDAIGMGLNMDVDHVAFAGLSKYDGRQHRPLRADEIAQIAGRAGRFRRDGTFGETADCADIDPETVERIENHQFEPVDSVEWRSAALDFASPAALVASLDAPPPHPALKRVRGALDEISFQRLAGAPDIARALGRPWGVRRLWDLCQLPDFRRGPQEEHVRLIEGLARHLMEPGGLVPLDVFARRIAEIDRTDGDIEQLQVRLSAIRTWTYAANRSDWVVDAEHWRGETRKIEDRLSDTLHERLMQRFIDKRTAALLKGLKREDVLAAEVGAGGEVNVEGYHLGRIKGLRFLPDPMATGLEQRAVKNVAFQALRPVLAMRLAALAGLARALASRHTLPNAPPMARQPSESEAMASAEEITLTDTGRIKWQGEEVARLVPRQPLLKPRAELVGGELGTPEARAKAVEALDAWLLDLVARDLSALITLKNAAEGIVPPQKVTAEPVKSSEPAAETEAAEPVSEAPGAADPEPAPESEPATPEEVFLTEMDVALGPQEPAAAEQTPAPPAKAERKPRPAKPEKPQLEALQGLARGMAFRVVEAGGVIDRAGLEADLAALSQADRKALRAAGLRFGRAGLYLPALLKPRAARLHAILAHHARGEDPSVAPFLPPAGATSVRLEAEVSAPALAAIGYRAFGTRAIRLDIVDRIADSLFDAAEAAKGPAAFPSSIVSLLGCPQEEAEAVARALGWESVDGPPQEDGTPGPQLWRRARPPRPPRPEWQGRGGGAGRPPRDNSRDGQQGDRPRYRDGPRDGQRESGRPFGREGGRDGDRRGSRGDRVISAGPQGRRSLADSPFAVLAALRPPPPPPAPKPARPAPVADATPSPAVDGEAPTKKKRKRPPRKRNRNREGNPVAGGETMAMTAETDAVAVMPSAEGGHEPASGPAAAPASEADA